MSSPEHAAVLRFHTSELLGVARASIEHGLAHGRALAVDPTRYPEKLREPAGCFVTLRRAGALRGCVGRLEPDAPLVCDVADRAHAAAFDDPRFAPLARDELEDLDVHLAVLGPLEALAAASEPELLERLRPGVDGLVLAAGSRRATFLPAVWSQLPAAADFVLELKRKAGIAAEVRPPELRAWRYEVISLAE